MYEVKYRSLTALVPASDCDLVSEIDHLSLSCFWSSALSERPGVHHECRFGGTYHAHIRFAARWASSYSDPQSITIGPGAQYNLYKSVIRCENAFAKNFVVQVSADGVTRSTVGTVTKNAVYTNGFTFMQAGRWARATGTSRTSFFGRSIYDHSSSG